MLNTIFTKRLVSTAVKMELSELVTRLHKFAPPWLSESWDNVGLLVEPSSPCVVDKLMLTNDLTEAVADEAVNVNASMILSYHPPVFKPLKRITQCSWKERIVLKCIENRIAVFSPHTCYDALLGGVNDWLISPFGGRVKPILPAADHNVVSDGDLNVSVTMSSQLVEPFLQKLQQIDQLTLKHRFTMEDLQVKLTMISSEKSLVDLVALIKQFDAVSSTLEVIKLTKPPMSNYGQGRVSVLDCPVSLRHCVDMVKSHLNLSNVRLACAVGRHIDDGEVRSVAVCAGAGSSVLSGVKADVFITGEMSHHDLLNAVHCGTSVILCEHSNSERGFLAVLQHQLYSLFDERVEVCLSIRDRDPVEIV